MIVKKTNNRTVVYGEQNDPATVIADNHIADTYLVGVGNKGIKYLPKIPNSILIVNGDGEVEPLSLSGRINQVIITDSEGNITFMNRSEL